MTQRDAFFVAVTMEWFDTVTVYTPCWQCKLGLIQCTRLQVMESSCKIVCLCRCNVVKDGPEVCMVYMMTSMCPQ